jgi:hypothetical protein
MARLAQFLGIGDEVVRIVRGFIFVGLDEPIL